MEIFTKQITKTEVVEKMDKGSVVLGLNGEPVVEEKEVIEEVQYVREMEKETPLDEKIAGLEGQRDYYQNEIAYMESKRDAVIEQLNLLVNN